jgi:uncharacterized protein
MDAIIGSAVRELDRAECERILARNHVGRLAYARKNLVDIEPVHYVYADGWVHGRTSVGRKLSLLGSTWWPVAFEVDEVEDLWNWRSVVVHGGFYPAPRARAEHDPTWQRAIELLRTFVPETFTERDPFPQRDVLFRIAAQELTGRESGRR